MNATPSQGSVPLEPSTCGALNALLRLIEQLPNHLLPSDPNLYAAFIQNQESIRFALKQAENHETDKTIKVPVSVEDLPPRLLVTTSRSVAYTRLEQQMAEAERDREQAPALSAHFTQIGMKFDDLGTF